MRRTASIAAAAGMAVICGVTAGLWSLTRPHQGTTTVAALAPYRAAITIDGARPGPVFGGIGAISGGGGNSRLLIDYPAAERSRILDYLFSPRYGASLQLLKLEIGGGGFSSDGSEPSVEPVRGQFDCAAGYEFWLAGQAVARDPAIKLYGLQWSAPSWVRGDHGGLWSHADVSYIVDWLRCARRSGLTISYIGGWNEHYQGAPAQQAWFVDLRAALDAAGFADTRIVAADETPEVPQSHGRIGYTPELAWETIAGDIVANPSFGRAVSVLGVHDVCGMPTTGFRCVVAAAARSVAARTGKPLWESELGATPATGTNPVLPGPAGLARALIDAYNQAGITGILVWPLIDAMPPDLPHQARGLVVAGQPWDGSYDVTPLTWVIAQTTQFTAPGWRHAAHASGDLPAGGSYTTYLAPGGSAWSLVAQTSVAAAAQLVTIHVSRGLPARVVRMWTTNLRGPGQFVEHAAIVPRRGVFAVLLRPGYVYTFTTTSGQSRAGGHAPGVPPARPMPVRYSAAPDSAGMADMLAPVEGSFGYVHGVLTQTTAGEPVEWQYLGKSPAPYAIVGQDTWRDYTVSARVILPAPGTGAALIARFQGFSHTTVSKFRGYELTVRDDGAWQLVANGPAAIVLASGRVAIAGRACTLGLAVHGSVISARINGTLVAAVASRAYPDGPAGLGSLGYYPVRFPSFTVSQQAPARPPAARPPAARPWPRGPVQGRTGPRAAGWIGFTPAPARART